MQKAWICYIHSKKALPHDRDSKTRGCGWKVCSKKFGGDLRREVVGVWSVLHGIVEEEKLPKGNIKEMSRHA